MPDLPDISSISFEKSLYVACALNGAPAEYIADVSTIRVALEREGINVLHFLGLGDWTPSQIYNWDIKQMVGRCSAFLGIYGHFSDGRGVETARALDRGIPMLGVALKGAVVTKVITGMYEEEGRPFCWVDDLAGEVPALAIDHFRIRNGVL